MRIDKRLNLIVPIYDDEQVPKLGAGGEPEVGPDGKPVMVNPVVAHVHAVPLAAEIVDKHFLILAQTFSSIFNQGLGVAAGPAVSLRLLRKIAENTGAWGGPDGVEQNVVAEMRRTANVVVPAQGGGWEAVPLQVAADRGAISEEDRAEVENAVVFFIVVSATLARAQRRTMLEEAAGLWGARVSSSTCTEFTTSLRTSTATASSGARSPAPAPGASGTANAATDGRPASVPV